MINEQIKLEQDMFSLCSEKYISNFNQEKEKSFSNTQAATMVIKKVVGDYAFEIKKNLDTLLDGMPGRHATAIKCLCDVGDSRKIALIVLKAVFNILYQKPTVQKVVNAIADALDGEAAFIQFKRKNKFYYEQVLSDLNKRNASNNWKNIVLTYKFAQKENFYANHWNHAQKQHVGLYLLELLFSFNLVEIKYIYEHSKTIKYVVPTLALLEIIENLNNRLKTLNVSYVPMICEPKRWCGVYEGGYILPHRRSKFIKHNDRDYLQRAQELDLTNCFEAVNLIQSTSWKINKNILNVIRQMWERNISLGGLPDRNDVEIPPFPYPNKSKSELTKEQKAQIKAWKQDATQRYRKNIQLRSVRLSTVQIINIASQFEEYDKIYFPCQTDFRGRIYPIPILLQPQGCDLSRGLLTFADGKPLTECGLKWLMIHCANCWGLSKDSYEARVKWVKDNLTDIKQYAQSPLENLEWTKADKPFQFLASCFELQGYFSDPENFISTLPVHTDGTNNGTQHYSALLKDEKAGKYVNLIDCDTPQDIYQIVADNLIEKLHQQDDKILAQKWLELGINRKLTKRPVMTLVYGATKYSCKDYIKDFLLENYDINHLHEHFGRIGVSPMNTVLKASIWLSNILWESIRECLPCAVTAMDYLRKIARAAAKKQKPLEWFTPMGMLIYQAYLSHKECRINTETQGSIKSYRYKDEIGKYDIHKQVNGVCPNFVHSLDASCLMLWAHRCSENGINRYSAIHDSYGVVAEDAELSQKILRQCFVEIYSSYDILDKFVDDITSDLSDEEKSQLPQKPDYGSLDLKEVLTSRYFFS